MNKSDSSPSNSTTPAKAGSLDGDQPPDAELVQRSQDGDLTAFDVLVCRYRGRIYAMIMNMIHNDADAWDLTQDSFVKAWKALPKFAGQSSFFTWMYRISHNVTYDWLRKKSNKVEKAEYDETIDTSRIDFSAPTAPRAAASPAEGAERSELRQQIGDAIQQLSPDHREVILLKEIEGLSYQEIADSTGCSIGTVMSRLHYARKKLQQTLHDLQP